MMKRYCIHAVMFFAVMCSVNAYAQHNTLTKREKRKGWELLFDGETTTGWRNFNRNGIGPAWKVEDGALYLDKNITDKEERGDIVTAEQYENFDLRLEWKIDACGNSGIMFNVVEDPKYEAPWQTGPEMQILDNACHPDAKIEKHRAGDLYDLIKSRKEPVKPAGEWNSVRIVSKDGRYRFWLNGERVVTFKMHTDQWKKLVEGSKFNTMPDFAKAKYGHIALQDHGDKVSFRNIKIKKLR